MAKEEAGKRGINTELMVKVTKQAYKNLKSR